ncbi:MAG: hypothetical protein A4C66_11860 [Nitrospira sp. HN-bin3]|uniref:hypothetical protein n=1 Tax=Nitrospira cf. moscoviensis SBR1015 TaxID=96242 RepID=UPI000A0D92CD|nr:hypothetical protein [Nitrospira cf. moscoviensis SBR1015]OQW38361.1 MAG: hypothetical protein A4C66_11860 [Nitrospira sp. HN-bin3]
MDNDWRTSYIICPHVIDAEGQRHRGFRVCCEACWEAGFLDVDLATAPGTYPAGYDVRVIAEGAQ